MSFLGSHDEKRRAKKAYRSAILLDELVAPRKGPIIDPPVINEPGFADSINADEASETVHPRARVTHGRAGVGALHAQKSGTAKQRGEKTSVTSC
jgi:hypothetical protein